MSSSTSSASDTTNGAYSQNDGAIAAAERALGRFRVVAKRSNLLTDDDQPLIVSIINAVLVRLAKDGPSVPEVGDMTGSALLVKILLAISQQGLESFLGPADASTRGRQQKVLEVLFNLARDMQSDLFKEDADDETSKDGGSSSGGSSSAMSIEAQQPFGTTEAGKAATLDAITRLQNPLQQHQQQQQQAVAMMVDTSSSSSSSSSSSNGSGAGGAAAAPIAAVAGAYSSRDEGAKKEEDAGAVVFRVIGNDGERQKLIWLTQVKNIFATQLPKMPREYIARLVFDRRHRSLLALKNDRVVGGICYRPFFTQRFAEIAFCAVTSSEQVKGYGTRLMNHLKEAVKLDGIHHFLTYADNYAIGYFKKQGFTKQVSMPPEQWVGYIKDYDGGTLMECTIATGVNYLDIPGMVKRQRAWLIEQIQAVGEGGVVRPGLPFPPPPLRPSGGGGGGAGAAAGGGGGGGSSAAGEGYLSRLPEIPGVAEAGWSTAAVNMMILRQDRAILQARLREMIDKLLLHGDSWPFREPVDVRLVPHYLEIVKEPMDLSLISRRVDAGLYNSLEHFLADVHLMLRNCRAFNRGDTEYVACANKLEAFVRARVTQSIFAPGPPVPTLPTVAGPISLARAAAATAAAAGGAAASSSASATAST